MLHEKKRVYGINESMRAVADCVENLLSLEDHAYIHTDRCKKCMQKHLLKAHGCARDAIEQDHNPNQTKVLISLERRVRNLFRLLESYENNPNETNGRRLGSRTRVVRKWACRTFDLTHVMSHIGVV